MKRYGHIIEQIVTDENLNASFDWVLRTRARKNSRTGRKMLDDRENVIARMKREIEDGTFRIGPLKRVERMERGKLRKIDYATLYDRMVLNAVMTVVEPYLNRSFVNTTGASITGRGGLYLHRMLREWRQKDPDGTAFVYQCDIRKFYETVVQEIVIACLRRKFKDERLLCLLEKAILAVPSGISIGLRTSQSEGNLYLSDYFDHVFKDAIGIRHFLRYCDNMLFLASDYRTLTGITRIAHEQAYKCGLQIKGDEVLFPTAKRDIDFLSWRLFADGRVEIRKHIKQRFARRWKRVRSRKRRTELIGSFYGVAKHADARHLFKTITGISMKKFAELGLSYENKDGKKHFNCQTYPLSDLQNRTIAVLDFERDVKTKEGDGRYLIHFSSGELGEGKFFTNSDELKQLLDKALDAAALPFETTMKRVNYDRNKVKYIFT